MLLPRLFLAYCLVASVVPANAQQFKPVQENPFGINTSPYAYNDMQFADLTKDGAFDIIFSDTDDEGPFILFNEGVPDVPEFNGVSYLHYLDEDANGLGSGTFTSIGSLFYDIDNDGDFDLLYPYPSDDTSVTSSYAIDFNKPEVPVGNFLFYFLGSVEGDAIGLPFLPYNILEAPTIGDLDNDGDDDILACRFYEITSGHSFSFYENISNDLSMSFNNVDVESPFGLPLSTNGEATFGLPCLIDGDLDGDLDLLVSVLSGDWQYYENTGTPAAPHFAAPTTNPLGLTSLPKAGQVHAIDVNNDGLTDLIVGANDKVYYFEHQAPSATDGLLASNKVQLSPNPVNSQLTIRSEDNGITSISLLDVNGRIVQQLQGSNTKQMTLGVERLAQGIYYTKIETADGEIQGIRFYKQ